ncbi:hypothetical protein D3C73_1353720 [compost metagenome]
MIDCQIGYQIAHYRIGCLKIIFKKVQGSFGSKNILRITFLGYIIFNKREIVILASNLVFHI